MINKFKAAIKKAFNILGLQLSKVSVVSNAAYQTVQTLKAYDINVVLDVGANAGQFSKELRAHGYLGKIISFEPLEQAHSILLENSKQDDNWVIHPRCAVGAEAGEIEINVAGNSVSSSILPMLARHEKSSHESKYTSKEKVPLIKIDDVFEQYCNQGDRVFMKVDTQGYEAAVLEGAKKSLKKCKGILLELSLVPLYEGQKLWSDLIEQMALTNHVLYALQPGFTDLVTGQTLQVDGFFFIGKTKQ